MILPWLVSGLLAVTTACLLIKIYIIKKSIEEIGEELETYIKEDSAATITVSSGDKTVRELAVKTDKQLSELRRLSRQYKNGDRELKEAVTNISHDLRTPLTSAFGYLDLLEDTECSDETRRCAQNIRNRLEALRQLTEELFRYSVIVSSPEPENERVNICSVLEEVIIGFEGSLHQAGIEPEISISADPVWRELNRTDLSRIYGNIISNAVKYSDGDLVICADSSGRTVFSNFSSGITAADAAKLFDRFYTADPSRRSTGLGLSIARILTERMNGRITAEYREGRLSVTVEFREM